MILEPPDDYRAMLAASPSPSPSPGKDGPGEEEIEAAAKRLWNVMRNDGGPEWEELAKYEDKPQDDFRKGARAVLRLSSGEG